MNTSSNLDRVLWVGGSPCSGKSSVAEILSERYGLHYYPCDGHFDAHAAAATAAEQPVLERIRSLRGDALWMRPVAELVADEIAAYREEFPFVVQDLLRQTSGTEGRGVVLAEGAALLPDEVFTRCGSAVRAVWMVPSAKFQWTHYRRRDWARDVVAACSDSERAFANWMQRDIEFADWVEARARALGYACLRVDESTSLAENIRWVELHLSLAPVKGDSA